MSRAVYFAVGNDGNASVGSVAEFASAISRRRNLYLVVAVAHFAVLPFLVDGQHAEVVHILTVDSGFGQRFAVGSAAQNNLRFAIVVNIHSRNVGHLKMVASKQRVVSSHNFVMSKRQFTQFGVCLLSVYASASLRNAEMIGSNGLFVRRVEILHIAVIYAINIYVDSL